MPPVAIFGAGGLGCLVHDTVCQAAQHQPIAFLDSDPAKQHTRVQGLPVLGGFEALAELKARGVRHAIVAIGDNHTRPRIANELERAGLTLISAIHPLATISPAARIGKHVVIGARAIVCVHATVEDHAVVSAGVIIEHDNRIGSATFIHPAVRLAGGVAVEDGATIGIGAAVIPGRSIGKHAAVAPGSVVIRDVPAHARVAGVPAALSAQTERGFEMSGVQVSA